MGCLALRCLLASAVALPVALAVSAPEARATAICPIGFYAINSPVTICERTLTVTDTWTVPAGVTSIDYVLVGAGGGGGGSSPGYGGTIKGVGGGGGAVSVKINYAVTSGANLYAMIGRGGTGPYGYSAGSAGETSFVPGASANGGGSEAEIASLSTDRAKAVATYLAERGVRVWMRFWGAVNLDGVGHPR